MDIKTAIQVFLIILNRPVTLMGYTFPLVYVLLFLLFASLLAFFIGGIFK